MKRMIDRLIPPDQAAELGIMAMMVYSLPRSLGTDAIAVYPGLGEVWRLQDAVSAWEESSSARYLLVAGTYSGEVRQPQPTLEMLVRPPINLRRTDGVHTQIDAQRTPDQAAWLVNKVKELGITSISLYASPFHLLRAYCTTVKIFEKSGMSRFPIVPMPVKVSPGRMIPETGVDAVDMFYGEAKRIALYQTQGDVLTLSELKDYMSWLWRQPIIANA